MGTVHWAVLLNAQCTLMYNIVHITVEYNLFTVLMSVNRICALWIYKLSPAYERS